MKTIHFPQCLVLALILCQVCRVCHAGDVEPRCVVQFTRGDINQDINQDGNPDITDIIKIGEFVTFGSLNSLCIKAGGCDNRQYDNARLAHEAGVSIPFDSACP